MKTLENAGLFRFVVIIPEEHTYAVNSPRAGDDIKTVQEILGHATAGFTLSTYAHTTPGMKQESAKRMEQYIEQLRSGR